MTDRIQVKETQRYWGDFEGPLANIISQLQSELNDGWVGIEYNCDPFEDYSSPYLYKHRPENDKEYAERLDKKNAAELKAKEERRKEYEKLRKEFGDTWQTDTSETSNG